MCLTAFNEQKCVSLSDEKWMSFHSANSVNIGELWEKEVELPLTVEPYSHAFISANNRLTCNTLWESQSRIFHRLQRTPHCLHRIHTQLSPSVMLPLHVAVAINIHILEACCQRSQLHCHSFFSVCLWGSSPHPLDQGSLHCVHFDSWQGAESCSSGVSRSPPQSHCGSHKHSSSFLWSVSVPFSKVTSVPHDMWLPSLVSSPGTCFISCRRGSHPLSLQTGNERRRLQSPPLTPLWCHQCFSSTSFWWNPWTLMLLFSLFTVTLLELCCQSLCMLMKNY